MSLRAEGEAISGFKEGLPRRSFGVPRNDVNKVTYEAASRNRLPVSRLVIQKISAAPGFWLLFSGYLLKGTHVPIYRYKVKTAQGEVVTGAIDVENKESLQKQLRTQGLRLLAAQLVSTKPVPDEDRSLLVEQKRIRVSKARVRDEDILMFTRELHSLVRSGIPILSGLHSMAASTSHRTIKNVVLSLANDVEAGERLSDAMRRHPNVFEEVYVSSVVAGEAAGQLPEVLSHLISLLEHRIETRGDIQTATRYPLIVLITLGIGFGIIINFVIPKFAGFYAKFNAELPLPTRFLIALGHLTSQHGLAMLVVLTICIFAVRIFLRTPIGKSRWDQLTLQVPVFGPLYHKIALSTFAATLEMLYRSGVPITEALRVAAHVTGNDIVRRGVIDVREGVLAGEPIAAVMKRHAIFPSLMVQMMSTGEQTGNLDQLLRDLANHYDRQVKYETKNLTTLIEPMLTILLGGMVLVFALGIFLPMWNMIHLFR
ncbi:MAG: hypothetical protein COV74_02705 [Candidatus Omnitrophica bacterium CG11_big_fil_rev_8_21_14_0_20_45_26]|uniref:Type II secretion system protein GspF domain-containing protein n=1 Tax=Candidatus Abzuiibacterium crystallinum TaxID=1974748 RepID=A0A2H0LRA9_9BACT|nr:MAG: hypothetical protein COV74_02705 [Candidatus Omnitrophica bacterium CG11_big_fil_rev_8_21_14_0_20_45_26]PIW65568.1 MAG: hypothetical protein COW12_01215 [Candidatus Omnitrophica bacterium CG12_big_fil_rev_8_21_14_0_65_45_16]